MTQSERAIRVILHCELHHLRVTAVTKRGRNVETEIYAGGNSAPDLLSGRHAYCGSRTWLEQSVLLGMFGQERRYGFGQCEGLLNWRQVPTVLHHL